MMIASLFRVAKRPRWALGGVLACGGLLAAMGSGTSCFVGGFELVDAPANALGGGGTGGGGGGGICGARPPGPPSGSDDGGNETFVVAVRSINFGEDFDPKGPGPTVGYDIDSECTCFEGAPPTCASVGNEPEECDGPDGRDNASARLFQNIALFEPDAFSSQHHTEQAEKGGWSILIRVRGYNGLANDGQVSVDMFSSPGLDVDPCGRRNPKWDGTDRWPVSSQSLKGTAGSGGAAGGGAAGGSGGAAGGSGGAAGGSGGAAGGSGGGLDCTNFPSYDEPLHTSTEAYVTDSVLVANLPSTSIPLSGEKTQPRLDLVGGFLTARIEKGSQGWQMNEGIVTGRWKLVEFFRSMSAIETGGGGICTDHALFSAFKSLVCNLLDVTAEVSGAAARCDSLSFGMAFEARPALLGATYDGLLDPLSCPSETDPTKETCSN